MLAVGALVFLSNWAGPIYFTLVGTLLLGGHGQTRRHIAVNEVDSRDWIQKEHEHVERLAKQEGEKEERRAGWEVWRRHTGLLTLWVGTATGAGMVACAVLRSHLFVWTVFSPKFLFGAAWAVAWWLGVGVGVSAGIWGVGMW